MGPVAWSSMMLVAGCYCTQVQNGALEFEGSAKNGEHFKDTEDVPPLKEVRDAELGDKINAANTRSSSKTDILNHNNSSKRRKSKFFDQTNSKPNNIFEGWHIANTGIFPGKEVGQFSQNYVGASIQTSKKNRQRRNAINNSSPFLTNSNTRAPGFPPLMPIPGITIPFLPPNSPNLMSKIPNPRFLLANSSNQFPVSSTSALNAYPSIPPFIPILPNIPVRPHMPIVSSMPMLPPKAIDPVLPIPLSHANISNPLLLLANASNQPPGRSTNPSMPPFVAMSPNIPMLRLPMSSGVRFPPSNPILQVPYAKITNANASPFLACSYLLIGINLLIIRSLGSILGPLH